MDVKPIINDNSEVMEYHHPHYVNSSYRTPTTINK